ncbi:MAG: hypothetical protein IJB74_09510 [Clostridia bacterium]|nr:hypothetical protein [Clostridia bacterium]
MKKTVSVLLCVLISAFSFIPCVGAYQSDREYFDDGSYIMVSDEFPHVEIPGDGSFDDNVSIEGDFTSESSGDIISRFLKMIREFIGKVLALLINQKTVTETKYLSYYSSDGDLLWTVYLSADFTYNGKKSVCDDVKTFSIIYDSDWTLISREGTKNGSTASAYFKIRQNKLGVPLKTIERTVSISCDKDGNIK